MFNAKECTKCGIVKIISEYDRTGRTPKKKKFTKSTFAAICKACRKEYYSKYIKKHGRIYNAINQRIITEKYRKKYPERRSANAAIRHAVNKEIIFRSKICMICSEIGNVYGHHLNYKYRYLVVWVCTSCHKRIHTGKISL